jgi:hypothetical protein
VSSLARKNCIITPPKPTHISGRDGGSTYSHHSDKRPTCLFVPRVRILSLKPGCSTSITTRRVRSTADLNINVSNLALPIKARSYKCSNEVYAQSYASIAHGKFGYCIIKSLNFCPQLRVRLNKLCRNLAFGCHERLNQATSTANSAKSVRRWNLCGHLVISMSVDCLLYRLLGYYQAASPHRMN